MAMKQEDKELLLKDLCSRLPYGVEVAFQVGNNMPDIRIFTGKDYDYLKYYHFIDEFTNCTFKPYLRSISSMTEEEMNELKTLCSIYIPTDSPTIGFGEYGIIVFTHHLTNNTYSFKLSVSVIDWLLKNHFDYRGLIEKGLAIEVNKENNPYK